MDTKKIIYSTIDEYIATFPPDVQAKLLELRKVIRTAAPAAEEKISYQMPAFRLQGILVYFAAFAHHIGFYPTGGATETFKKELAGYKTGKGSIQFPLDKPLPLELIRKIVKFRVSENLNREKQKTRPKTTPKTSSQTSS